MTSMAFQRAVQHILEWEGGYSNHAADPGGATKYGITRKTLSEFVGRKVSREEVQAMDRDLAVHIYHRNYWKKIMGDRLPPAISLIVMDAAANSGVRTAGRFLQTALNEQGNQLKRDGLIGERTLAAVDRADIAELLDEYIVRRAVFYGALRTFTSFGLGWARRLVSTARRASSLLRLDPVEAGIPGPPAPLPDDTSPERQSILPPGLSVRRHFFDERGVQVYGTFFECWGGWMTAGHVLSGMLNTNPPFAKGESMVCPGGLDAAMIGCSFPKEQPPAPHSGQHIYVAGYPAGAQSVALRQGEVYLKRPGDTSWIATIETPAEPVVVGMSGGLVCDKASNTPIGILITRNSPANLDGDAQLEQNFDFVSLHDLWAEARQLAPGV